MDDNQVRPKKLGIERARDFLNFVKLHYITITQIRVILERHAALITLFDLTNIILEPA